MLDIWLKMAITSRCHHGHCRAISIKVLKRKRRQQSTLMELARLIFVIPLYPSERRQFCGSWLLAEAAVAIAISITPLRNNPDFVVRMNL
jgi:hypothetical protein